MEMRVERKLRTFATLNFERTGVRRLTLKCEKSFSGDDSYRIPNVGSFFLGFWAFLDKKGMKRELVIIGESFIGWRIFILEME